ncbi:MAG: hypothetical protein ACYCSN_02600 [Acidobacteriaceae bacterium]
MRIALLLSLALLTTAPLFAQQAQTQPEAAPSLAAQYAPIPDVETLMRQVEANQKHMDEIRKDYRYRALETDQDLNKDGSVKKTETEESEIFYVNGHTIERVVKRDGKDLNPKEQQKEQERVDKAVAQAKAAKPDTTTDSRGNTILSVSRLLQLGTVTAPRRMFLKGRSTLVFDFVGDRRAKSSNMSEGVMKDLTGTVWIDEADRQVIRMEAHFEQNFHIAGGMLVNIEKGTNFIFEQALVNNEVWLPTSIDGRGKARVLLLKSFNGHFHTAYSDYHKYTADVKILPGATPVTADPPSPPQP